MDDDTRMPAAGRFAYPAQLAIVYVAVAAPWVLFSDHLLAMWVADPRQAELLGSLKGVGFVLVTAALLYALAQRLVGQVERSLRRADQARRLNDHTQRLLAELLDSSPDAIFTKDLDGRYTMVNREVARVAGRNAADIVGRGDGDLFPPEQAAMLRAGDAAVMRDDAIVRRQETLTTVDGEIIYLVIKGPLHDADGHVDGMFGIARDMTDSVRAQQEIATLNSGLELRVAERTAELGDVNRELDAFAHAVSHDLRAPLRAMKGFALALTEDAGDALPAEAREHVGRITAAADRMGALIDGMLTLARSTRGEMTRGPVDVSALASRLAAELAAGDPGRAVEVDIEPGLIARGDPRMLEAVFANLLGNAWKYSARTPQPRVRVHAEQRADGAWICVSDNGAGFDMAHAARLFQPFGRLHRQDEFPGLGIGLATVRRIVARHGGAIDAHAEPGRGASFCIRLPDPVPE